MNSIKVAVIDDHPLFCQGVIDALSLVDYLEFVGQARDGKQGLQIIRQTMPDVAIVDVNLPGINGHQLSRAVLKDKIPTRVILLTAYDDSNQKVHAMLSGAAAYCTKDIPPEDLINVIEKVAAGSYMLEDRVLNEEQLKEWLGAQNERTVGYYSQVDETPRTISAREAEVLRYITHGYSNKEIARELQISHQTVKNHVTAILRKIGVEDRTQAALFALRHGWVRLQKEDPGSKE